MNQTASLRLMNGGSLWAIATLFLLGAAVGQDQVHRGDAPRDTQVLLEILETGDWTAIDSSIGDIRRMTDDEQVVEALLAALTRETTYQKANGPSIGEGRVEHLLNLIEAVSTMRDDRRVIWPLIGAIGLVGGRAIPEALANFTCDVVEPLSSAFGAGSARERQYVLITLKCLLDRETESATSTGCMDSTLTDSIRTMMLQGLHDEDPFVRSAAARALPALADSTVIAELRVVARQDSYSRLKAADGKEVRVYPVRDEAKTALRKLEGTATIQELGE